jgi:sulfate transport system ATP-binding protein
MTMSIALVIEHLEKSFGDFPALRGVSLTVEAGELVALLGPSGSGKTTLLRAIAGLEQAEGGRILFGAQDAAHLSLRDRRIGFVFQHYALFARMSVFENVAFGLRARPRRERPAEAEIRARVRALLDLVRLGGLEARFPAQLSGGQKQRVALARALAIEPRVLLLDEPFGALDAQVRRDLRRWLRELHQRTGHTTLFVTHDQEEAMELADRVAILNNGRIEQVGAPDDIYDAPASAFVCAFTGEANRFIGRAQAGRAMIGEGVDAPLVRAAAADGEVALLVRPADLALVDPAAAQAGACAPGVVTGRRRHGAGLRIEIESPHAQGVVEVDARPDDPLARAAVIGAPVRLRIARAHAFPLSTAS